MPLPSNLGPQPFSDDELDHDLSGPEPAGRVGAWQVTDDATAEWALRKLAEAQADMEKLQGAAERYHAEVHHWLEGRLRPLAARAAFFHGHLTAYAARVLSAKRKSLTLPSGRLTSRTPTKPKVVVADEEAFVAWARESELPELLRVTYKPDLASVRDAVLVKDGQVLLLGERVPGVVAEPPQTTYDAKPAGVSDDADAE